MVEDHPPVLNNAFLLATQRLYFPEKQSFLKFSKGFPKVTWNCGIWHFYSDVCELKTTTELSQIQSSSIQYYKAQFDVTSTWLVTQRIQYTQCGYRMTNLIPYISLYGDLYPVLKVCQVNRVLWWPCRELSNDGAVFKFNSLPLYCSPPITIFLQNWVCNVNWTMTSLIRVFIHGQIDEILRTANLFALKQQNKKQRWNKSAKRVKYVNKSKATSSIWATVRTWLQFLHPSTYGLHRAVLGLEAQCQYKITCYKLFVIICNQYLVHGFLACKRIHIQLPTIWMQSSSNLQQLSLSIKQNLALKVIHLKSSRFSKNILDL